MSFSRSRTRRFLLQSLYTRVITGISASKEAAFFEDAERIEDAYVTLIQDAILEQEGKILSVIYEAAPKYDIKSLPTVNALILMICLAEMLVVCPDDVPPRVSLDEAIELAKRYSDDASKKLINGILNTVIAQREAIIATWPTRKALNYSLFSSK
ncbi:transcription antitermination protein NusB [Candidatus Gracilibacteria bacterium]|nr:transcription antitermination protein NusB [Candidatus Gracilibacteria bacterium]